MSNTYDVVLSPHAMEDLDNIYSYIAYELQAPDIAQEQFQRIRAGVGSLDFLPFRYPIVKWEPWHSDDIHQFPIDHYSIFYQVDSEQKLVTVLRIFYGGRDVKYIVTLNTQ